MKTDARESSELRILMTVDSLYRVTHEFKCFS